ncbi:MAG: nucleotidyltransferase domain-containing protein [Desulfobulbaceae bacterium]|nr:nucleotidyltransferase domain-containing protein [Desulfobulbaceae bacterium]
MRKKQLLMELKSFKIVHQRQYGIVALGIFGSFARGEESDASDVDIVLETETPDLFNIVHIKEDLEKQLRLPVDIVRLRDKMNPFLKKRIINEAIYV